MIRIRLARRTRRAWLASHIPRRSKLLLAILGASLVVVMGGLFYLGGMVSYGLVLREREARPETETIKIRVVSCPDQSETLRIYGFSSPS